MADIVPRHGTTRWTGPPSSGGDGRRPRCLGPLGVHCWADPIGRARRSEMLSIAHCAMKFIVWRRTSLSGATHSEEGADRSTGSGARPAGRGPAPAVGADGVGAGPTSESAGPKAPPDSGPTRSGPGRPARSGPRLLRGGVRSLRGRRRRERRRLPPRRGGGLGACRLGRVSPAPAPSAPGARKPRRLIRVGPFPFLARPEERAIQHGCRTARRAPGPEPGGLPRMGHWSPPRRRAPKLGGGQGLGGCPTSRARDGWPGSPRLLTPSPAAARCGKLEGGTDSDNLEDHDVPTRKAST